MSNPCILHTAPEYDAGMVNELIRRYPKMKEELERAIADCNNIAEHSQYYYEHQDGWKLLQDAFEWEFTPQGADFWVARWKELSEIKDGA